MTDLLQFRRIAELPFDFARLEQLSLAEDFFAMRRLREVWGVGTNRFDRLGEALIEARDGELLVGICGLNLDPYANMPPIGRVRHLYVDPSARRRGIGRRLILAIIANARRHFTLLRLRTLRADADQFYVALGFTRVMNQAEVTHQMTLT